MDPIALNHFRSGDRQCLAALYEQHGDVVFRYLRRQLGAIADARDLTQEAFITAFRDETRRRFSGTTSFRCFVLGIAKNLLRHHLRAKVAAKNRAEQVADSLRSFNSSAPSVDDEFDQAELRTLLGNFIGRLNERDTAFFRTHMMEGPPRHVTAQALNMTVEQVRYLERQLKIRAVKHLKDTGYLPSAAAPRNAPAEFPNLQCAPA